MKRRNFLKTSTRAAVAAPIFLNGMTVNALPMSALFAAANGDSDRVLVLIQLNGGNDGLNTVIPLDQYDALANARPQVLLPENSLLNVTDTIGFHPAMTGMKSLYDDAKLSIVQGVGYPDQNRSHFRSTDIWTSGSASDEVVTEGWLGQNFERDHPFFPEGYPNEDCPDPFAVTMGSNVSATCQGTAANFSIAVSDPFNITALPEGALSTAPATPYGNELTYLRTLIEQSNAYGETVTAAANLGTNMVDYPADNRLAQQLKNIALLLSGGSQTRVFVCTLGGFDTHANQVQGNDTTQGEHAELLATLSEAINVFQADLQALDLAERVVGMTFSEFGRRIIANDANGTDHGSAAPLILFGSCVNPGIIGDNAEIPANVGIQDGVAMQYDFRDVYGSVLEDWFEVPTEDIEAILKPDYQHLAVLNPCDSTAVTDTEILRPDVENFPNPFRHTTTIRFTCADERVRLSVFNMLGHELKILADRRFAPGTHEVTFDGSGLAAGNYFYRLRTEKGGVISRVLVKI